MARSEASRDAVAYDNSEHRTADSAPDPETRRAGKDEPGLDGGAHIGRYVVLYRHGRGGMGHIYAAYDPELDRRVAIKLLRRSRKRGRDPHARMVREAQALARLSHPNVVAIHDVGVHEGRVWVAMDFLEGLTLRRWATAETRTLAQFLDVFAQAGRGLAAAHKAGLVHRDFKPENVIVDAEGRAQVLDFGLARASLTGAPSGVRRGSVDSADREGAGISTSSGSLSMRLTRDGALVGTPAYMAPEQHQRGPTDERTDQFAFCLAMYEALYRESPFAGDDEKELKTNVIEGNLRDAPRTTKVPTWLRKVLLRGLSVEPGDRWPSMDAVLYEFSRDRTHPRRRLVAVGSAVVIAGGLAVAGAAVLTTGEDRCADADAPVHQVWNDARKAEIERAFMDTDKPYAAAAWRNAAVVMSAQADAWSTARREACEATWVAGVQPQEVLVLRLSCLQRRLDELDGLA
ncbi:MAG: serine/threonine-protein kinase, partial [Myxococcota bacterium]